MHGDVLAAPLVGEERGVVVAGVGGEIDFVREHDELLFEAAPLLAQQVLLPEVLLQVVVATVVLESVDLQLVADVAGEVVFAEVDEERAGVVEATPFAELAGGVALGAVAVPYF
jgi:hypothetical protein